MIIARERIFDRYPVDAPGGFTGTPLPSLLFPRQHAPRDPPTAGAPSRVVALVALVALAPSPFVGAFRGLRRLHRATAAAAVAATAPAGAAVAAAAAAVATAAALLFVVGLLIIPVVLSADQGFVEVVRALVEEGKADVDKAGT